MRGNQKIIMSSKLAKQFLCTTTYTYRIFHTQDDHMIIESSESNSNAIRNIHRQGP
jgi:hypothetical protein